jgi:hypothetical protein
MTNFVTNYLEALPFSDTYCSFALAAATELTYTVPGTALQKWRLEFSYPDAAEVFVAVNATAQTPTAGTLYSDRSSEMNPKIRMVKGGDVIHLLSIATVTGGSISLLSIAG